MQTELNKVIKYIQYKHKGLQCSSNSYKRKENSKNLKNN